MFKNRIKAAAFSLAVLIISLTLPLNSAFASSSSKARTYRIGANALYGISKTEDGYSGLAYSYLNAISRYNNDKYIYVEGTAQELFEKLKDGEIDAIPCVTEAERDMYERLLGGENGSLFKRWAARSFCSLTRCTPMIMGRSPIPLIMTFPLFAA